MTLKSDGSGSLTIHYWAKEGDVTNIKKVSFDEKEIKDGQYADPSITVKSVKVETDKDTIKHAHIELEFKDITKLGNTKGFKDNVFELKKEGSSTVYTHTVKKDTSVSGDYKLDYEVILPAKPEKVDGKKIEGDKMKWDNKTVDGNKVKWENKLDAISKADLVMTASFAGGGSSMMTIIIIVVVVVVIVIVVVMMRKKPAPPQA